MSVVFGLFSVQKQQNASACFDEAVRPSTEHSTSGNNWKEAISHNECNCCCKTMKEVFVVRVFWEIIKSLSRGVKRDVAWTMPLCACCSQWPHSSSHLVIHLATEFTQFPISHMLIVSTSLRGMCSHIKSASPCFTTDACVYVKFMSYVSSDVSARSRAADVTAHEVCWLCVDQCEPFCHHLWAWQVSADIVVVSTRDALASCNSSALYTTQHVMARQWAVSVC